MKRIFADTSYWIALLFDNDFLHERALEASRNLGSYEVVTTSLVLLELVDGTSNRGSTVRKSVNRSLEAVRDNNNVTIIWPTENVGLLAYKLWASRDDKGWTLTDCISFQVMHDLGITEALTHDKHFVQAGFRALLRDDS